jgi:hypothetical protein
MFRIVEPAAAALNGVMNEIQALRSLSLLTTLALIALTLAVSALF